ncbi:hypothetical protein PR048_021438 [Dryococelus australis]|uniref:Uncharacterized protein n=1 Tax=Dryococelus australis TaxID=614101 RepID=A0ABQ9GY81_9NEOP|nr:hypothetical protein PR048_021438 [Dryococelus australis]
MEADIKEYDFVQSEKLLGLKFNKLIGEILTFCKMVDYINTLLTDLTKNTNFPVTSRYVLKQQIPRFRTAVDKAIKYRAAGNEPLNTRICMLEADVENSPLHIFGDHEHCNVYFHNGNKEGEINHELFNSIVNKHIAGKCINYALRGQYKTLCSAAAAAVSFNKVGDYMRVIHKTMMGGNS